MSNPLLQTIRQFGLTPSQAAKLFKVNPKSAFQALAEKPNGAVQAYIDIQQGLMLKHKIAGVPPLCISFDAGYIDGLHKDAAFRRLHRFYPIHEDIAKFRDFIVKIRAGSTLREVATRLEDNFVPTWQGHRNWRASTVQHFTNRWTPQMEQVARSEPKQTFKRDWRDFVIRDWWLMPCFPDPAWIIRYELSIAQVGNRVRVMTGRPLPKFMAEVLLANMGKNRWLAGKWTVDDGDACTSAQAEPVDRQLASSSEPDHDEGHGDNGDNERGPRLE